MRKLICSLSFVLFLFGCQSESQKSLRKVELLTPYGDKILTTLAISEEEQTQGLSGVKPQDFEDDQGMLFFYMEDSEKNFWMPDTYFDLDLIYLDKDLKVIDIIRKLPFYIGRNSTHLIPRARPVWSRHTLEMKATSPISQKLKIGDQLTWKGQYSLQEMEEKIKLKYSR